MALVLDVLDVAGDTIWFVLSDHHPVCAGLSAAVMTLAASGARRLPIDRIESLVTTGTRQLPFRVAVNAGHDAYALHVQRVKLLAAPGFVCVRRQAGDCDLFAGPLIRVQSLPNPVPILSGI